MTDKNRPIRTALFVPGNRPERVDKAVNAGADAVIIDLEDAVPMAMKHEVRPLVRDKVLQHKDNLIMVRVNALDTEFFQGDLDAVVVDGLTTVMVPMVETVDDIRLINQKLLEVEKKHGLGPGAISIMPLIETAKAVQNIYQIVSEKTEPDRLWTVAFGAADYTLAMGVEMTPDATELNYPRARIAVACRAADVHPPIDTPYMIDIKDLVGLETDTRRAKQFGFQGRLCVHPSQVDPCNEIFSPSLDEILHARKIIQAFDDAEANGQAAIQFEGKLIDYPVVERSRMILKLAETIGNTKP